MACVGPWLQSEHEQQGYRAGSGYPLQWEHETLAGDWHAQVSESLV